MADRSENKRSFAEKRRKVEWYFSTWNIAIPKVLWYVWDVNGRRRCKWVPMRLPVEGTSARKAQKAFDEIRLRYEREEEERLEREAKAKEIAENTHPDALLPFTEYMEKWLQSTRSSLATATYQS